MKLETKLGIFAVFAGQIAILMAALLGWLLANL